MLKPIEFELVGQITGTPIPIPLETATVKSTETAQTVEPSTGFGGFDKVQVEPLELEEIEVTENGTYETEKDGIKKVVVDVDDSLADVTVKSTETEQTIEPTDTHGFGSVTVNPIIAEAVTVKSTEAEQIVTPSSGKDYIKQITVEPIALEEASITPTTSEQTVQPTIGKDGIKKVTVDPIQTEQGSATADGEYTPTLGKFFNSFTVNTGLIFGNCGAGSDTSTHPVVGSDTIKFAYAAVAKTIVFWRPYPNRNRNFGFYNNSYQGNVPEPWRDYAENIERIIFDESIVTLESGENLFGACVNLKEVFCGPNITFVGKNFGGNCPNLNLYTFAIPSKFDSASACHSLNVFKSFSDEGGTALPANVIRFPSWDMAAASDYRHKHTSASLELLDFSEPPAALTINVTAVANSAFLACTTIESATDLLATTIGYDSFKDCTNLADVYFPKLESIGVSSGGCRSFMNTAIRHFTAPKTLTKIGRSAFQGNAQAETNDFVLDFTEFDENNIDTSGEIEVLNLVFDYGFGYSSGPLPLNGEIWFSSSRVMAAAQNTTNLSAYSNKMVLKTA